MHERALKGATMQSKFIPRRRLPWVAAAATLTAVLMLVVGLGTASAHDPVFGVQPAIVSDTVPPGGDLVVNKTVHTPVVPPTPDIFFVFDTTGSMGDDIATVQAKLGDLITAVDGLTLDAQFGVAKYEDYPFAPWGQGTNVAYDLLQPITADTTAVTTAINALATFSGSGFDTPESGYEALFQALTGAGRDLPNPDGTAPDGDFLDPGEIAAGQDAGFRPDASQVILLVGDAAFHNPGDPPTSVQFATGYPGAGEADVLAAQGDVSLFCLIPAELEGVGPESQCDSLGATSFDVGASSVDIVDAIIEALGEVELEVTPSVGTCDSSLAVSFDQPSKTVVSGEDALFVETIDVSLAAPQGTTVQCTVNWLVDGVLPGPEFVQQISITIPDVTPPVVRCVETTNPHGQNVPPAGSTTLPGPKGGQNEDGFYELLAVDNVDPNPEIFVVDLGSGTIFPSAPLGFPSGTKIKYTQAPGATPSIKKIGSTNGEAGAVAWHIKGTGDMAIFAVDDAGNVSARVTCLVPPPPK
jgi:hypothetical protein